MQIFIGSVHILSVSGSVNEPFRRNNLKELTLQLVRFLVVPSRGNRTISKRSCCAQLLWLFMSMMSISGCSEKFSDPQTRGSVRIGSFEPKDQFLPAATKLWPRLCFYSCL